MKQVFIMKKHFLLCNFCRVRRATFFMLRYPSISEHAPLVELWCGTTPYHCTATHPMWTLFNHLNASCYQQEALLSQRDCATRLLVEILQLKTPHLKTRVPGLSCGIIWVILRLAVFVQYQSVTDTHRQTDRRTDTRQRHVPRLA